MLFTQKVKPEKRVVRLNSKNHLFLNFSIQINIPMVCEFVL